MQTALFDVTEHRESIVDREALRRALLAPHIAIDIETETRWNGTGPKKDFGLSYCADPTYISLAWREGKQATGTVLGAPFDEETRAALCQIVGSAHTVIMHNAVFDCRPLSRLTDGKTPQVVWDTAVMARLLHPQVNGNYNLIAVAAQVGVPTTKEQREMKGERKNLHKLPVQKVIEYAYADAMVTFLIYEAQQALILDATTADLVDWEMRAMREYCRMAAQGVKLNLPYVKARALELHETVKQTSARLRADGLVNPGSTQQRAKYIYEKKGIPRPDPDENPEYFTETGGLSTKAEVIEALLEQFPEHAGLLADLVNHMGVDRMLSTLENLLDHAAIDGRIHSQVSIATDTSRRASSNPNCQNWKMAATADDLAGDMCGIAVGEDGFTLVEADLKGAELWMTALVSGDDNFAAALSSSDFHSTMAEIYFGDAFRRATGAERDLLRRKAKNFTFGMLYGMGAAGLAKRLGVPLQRAYELLNALERNFPAFVEAKKFAEQKAEAEGYINLWTGRKIPVDPNRVYTTWDYLCQGGVAELIKRSIVLISEEYARLGLRSRVALDMHDAVVIEVAHSEWDEALQIAQDIISQIVPAEFNERTTPPVCWVAEIDPDKNSKKWGKGQWHPGQNGQPAIPLEIPNTSVSLPDPAEFVPVDPGQIPLLQISFPELAFTWQLRIRRGVKFSEMTHKERGEARAFFVSLWNRLDQEFEKTFETYLPAQGDGGQVILSQPLTVNLVNHAKVLLAWLMVAEQGVDTAALIGLNAEELRAEAARRQAYVDLLEKRVCGCIEWVAALVQEGDLS